MHQISNDHILKLIKNSYRDTTKTLCYHVAMQILCYYGNNMNTFQRKSLKLKPKRTTSQKEEIIRLQVVI